MTIEFTASAELENNLRRALLITREDVDRVMQETRERIGSDLGKIKQVDALLDQYKT